MVYSKIKLKYLFLLLLGQHFFQYGMEQEELKKSDAQILQEGFQAIGKKDINELKSLLYELSPQNLDRFLKMRRWSYVPTNHNSLYRKYLFGAPEAEKLKVSTSWLGSAFIQADFWNKKELSPIIEFLIEIASTLEGTHEEMITRGIYSPMVPLLKMPAVLINAGIGDVVEGINLKHLELLLNYGVDITSQIISLAKERVKPRESVEWEDPIQQADVIIRQHQALRNVASCSPTVDVLKKAIADNNPYVVYLALYAGKLKIQRSDLEGIQESLKDTRSEKIINQYFDYVNHLEKIYGYLTHGTEHKIPKEIASRIINYLKPSFVDSRIFSH